MATCPTAEDEAMNVLGYQSKGISKLCLESPDYRRQEMAQRPLFTVHLEGETPST